MTATLVLAIITVLVASQQAAVLKSPSPRASLNIGEIGFGDRLLHRQFVSRSPLEDIVQWEDVLFRGDNSMIVTAVIANELGVTQDARVRVAFGGVGSNRVTIRIISAVGNGYQYLVDVWGRTVEVLDDAEMTDQVLDEVTDNAPDSNLTGISDGEVVIQDIGTSDGAVKIETNNADQ